MSLLTEPVVTPGTLATATQPVISTDFGLLLRPWASRDLDVVVEAYADPAIQQWHFRSMSESEAAEWIGSWADLWQAESDANWAIVDANTDVVLGRIGLRRIQLHAGQAEVSYWVMPAARGQGVATTATLRLCSWAFSVIGIHRLELAHSVRNEASCRVAANAQFLLEGTRREALLHPDGWHDMHLHARLATD